MYKQIFISIHEMIVIVALALTILSICCLLIQQKNKRLSELRMHLAMLRTKHHEELSKAGLEAQEEERVRIGQNLHDDLGSVLATLKLTLEMPVYEQFDNHSFTLFKTTCKHLVDKTVAGVRNIAHNMLPASFESHGLVAAVEDMVEAINNTGSLTIFLLDEAGAAINQLPHNTALSLYRVLEELLTNTIKHAHAREVFISISARDGFLLIGYKDDGRGIALGELKGMGMRNIEKRLQLERALYTIATGAGQGFLIEIKLNIQ